MVSYGLKKLVYAEAGKGYRYRVWLRQSAYDLNAATVSLKNGFPEWACFQSEQCVEKALKAVIVHSGFRPPKIHKISILISFCNRVNPEFKKTKFNFRDIESFTFISRYPFLIPGENSAPHDYITFEDANLCLSEAKRFFQQIQELLKESIVL